MTGTIGSASVSTGHSHPAKEKEASQILLSRENIFLLSIFGFWSSWGKALFK